MNIVQWQNDLINGRFNNPDRKTQIIAGWYDWFCKDSSLRAKTIKMGNIIKRIKDGGKVDLINWYVWFKNNCPLNGPLYDDFRFAAFSNSKVQMTILIDCCWNKSKYTVYGRKTIDGNFDTITPLFEADNARKLIKWLNEPWDK